MARDRETRQDGLEEHVVKIRRCAAVVKGGRRFSFNALVVVGDKRGRVAWGYGKANEVPPAVEKASKDATDSMRRQKKIQLKGETIPHRIIGRFGGSRVILVPAGPGTGVKAGDLNDFDGGATIDPDVLRKAGLAKGQADGVRILGTGDLTKRLTVRAHHFSKSASEKITAKGGTADVIPPPKKPVRNKMKP